MNLDKNKIEEIQTLLDFLSKLALTIKLHKKQIPIHLFNVREYLCGTLLWRNDCHDTDSKDAICTHRFSKRCQGQEGQILPSRPYDGLQT